MSTALVVGAGLLMGAVPVTASTGAGIIVSATAQDADSFWLAPHVVSFRATGQMVESEIEVTREGSTVIVSESQGGPSLALEAPSDRRVTCSASNPTGLSQEIRCTFGGSTSSLGYGIYADFATAPRGVTFSLGSASQFRSMIIGSAFDDYFEGGPEIDLITGNAGNDFVLGRGGDDALVGAEGDDVMYGDGDEEGRESGNDNLSGGPGDDYLEGGPGIDSMSGGPGRDELDAKDGIADAEVDCNDVSSRGQESDAPRFDRGLDNPIDCGVTELPWPVTTPALSPTSLIKPSTPLTAIPPVWGGTAPMTYSYRWESCTVSADGKPANCADRAKGNLDAQGRDSRTGKPPVYAVTAGDRNRSVRFVAIADNSKVKGGGIEEVPSVALPVGVESLSVAEAWLPRKSGTKWAFATALTVATALNRSDIAESLDVRSTGWRKSAVPAAMRKGIKDGDVFTIQVNGRDVKAKDLVEVAEGVRASIEVRYYSSMEDRKTCPATDADLESWRNQARRVFLDFQSVIDVLDELKCPWAVTWLPESAPVTAFSVRDVSIEETDDPDRPVQVRITALGPSTAPQLSVLVGAPPSEVVRQAPDHFTLGLGGAVYAFPGTKFTALWTSLMGDQTRMPTKRARVQLFVNGHLRSSGVQDADFSYNLAAVMDEPGLARIVISTLNGDGSINGQVYVDIPILDPASAQPGDLITWDGRCFTPDGNVASCAGRVPHANAETMRGILARAGLASLYTYSAVDALRIASVDFDARFTPFVVNGPVPTASTAARALPSPRSGCAWWDLGCHLRGVTEQIVRAVIAPKPAPRSPVTPPQPFAMQSRLVAMANGEAVPGVTRGEIAVVPGAGLIGLDGATVISDQGGSLISDQGGSFAGWLAGALARLIGLDGATLIGLDGATLIGLDGATFKPDHVALPLIGLDGAT